MSPNRLAHYKTIDYTEAKELQKNLRRKISLDSLGSSPAFVAGADISCIYGSDVMHAAIIVLELPELKPIAGALFSDETTFPYIPGLLAFREMPVLLGAWNQLQIKPDVLIMDGHGLAHPRRMGIATHFGIEVGKPTIGCAKNILTGTHEELEVEKGATADLIVEDEDKEEKVGFALRSRTKVNPVYISPGHKLSFDDAYSIIMKALTKYKLPKTTRLAHQYANRLRKGEIKPGYFEY